MSVDLHSQHDRYAGVTKNIGSGGVFVATSHALGVGDRVTLSFSLPGGMEPLSVEAEVRWIRPQITPDPDDRGAGMGLRFVNVSLDTSVLIQKFLRTQDPLYHSDS